MNWAAQVVDDGGWDGRRRFEPGGFTSSPDGRNIILPRLGGLDVLERRTVELNDACAEHPTPWKQLVMCWGAPALALQAALETVVEGWNEADADLGLKWSVVTFGTEQFRSLCSGVLKGDQPQVWVRCEYLPDRLWHENQAVDRARAAAAADKAAHDGESSGPGGGGGGGASGASSPQGINLAAA